MSGTEPDPTMQRASAATSTPDGESRLFDGGPPLRLLRLWGLLDPEHRHVRRRMLAVVAIGWLPLLVLALLALFGGQADVWRAFLQDASVHARSLVVAPLLVLAEAVCIPRLGALAREFPRRGIVPPSQRPRYDAAVRSIQRWRDAWIVEAIALVLASVAAILIVQYVPAGALPNWHRGGDAAPLGRSFASWWHALVSLPILLVLLLGWGWRMFLWGRYLLLVSRLDLRLVASHPEGAAGLMFCGESLGAFAILGLAIGTIVAATQLAHILAGGAVGLQGLGHLALGTVVFVLVALSAPLLPLCVPLFRLRRLGAKKYGALAQRVGAAFEDRCMDEARPVDATELLSSPEFSAVADLAASVEKANALRPVPLEWHNVAALAAATALPFGIVALTMVPFDLVLDRLLGLFL